jgi:drug/metabolite transporter (DMT)-like permease
VVLAPFKYSMIVWALVLAFAIWGEIPSMAMFAGAAIVIGSGLFIFYRERNTASAARRDS